MGIEDHPAYTSKLCDRCGSPASEIVTCWYGCQHRQCPRCATQTREEAAK